MNWIYAAYDWTLRARWRTWIAHTLLGLALAVPFGAWTVMVFYLLREVEQMAMEARQNAEGYRVKGDVWEAAKSGTWRYASPDWWDHILDAAVPFVVLGLAANLGL